MHGFPRATKDIDVFVWANPAAKVFRTLKRFGAPVKNLSAADFATAGNVFQIVGGPLRIDIITSIDGVRFEDAYPRRLTAQIDGLQVPVISRDDLIANKRATGRTQDLADVERLAPKTRTRSRDDDLTR